MKCNKNAMNLTIIIFLIFIILSMLYREKIYKKESFHGPYDKNSQKEVNINESNNVLNTPVDDIFAYIKSFFIF